MLFRSPSLGTLRLHLAALHANEGDEVLLRYGDDQTFSATLVREPTGDYVLDAAALVSPSEPESVEEALQVLTHALGNGNQPASVEDPPGATHPTHPTQKQAVRLLAEQFAAKGDEDVADLLRNV